MSDVDVSGSIAGVVAGMGAVNGGLGIGAPDGGLGLETPPSADGNRARIAPDAPVAVMRAFRLDAYLMFAQGAWFLIILFVAFPLLIVGVGLLAPNGAGGEGVLSACTGAMCGVLFVCPMSVFSIEDQGHGLLLDGIVPVTRARQVVGRYLLMVATMLLGGVYQALCLMLTQVMDHAPLWTWENTVFVVGVILVYLVIQSILLPLFYRFRAQKGLMVFFVGLVVLIACIALVGQLVVWEVVPAEAVAWIADRAAALVEDVPAHPLPYVCGAFVAIFAMLAISLLISVHVYRAKEL